MSNPTEIGAIFGMFTWALIFLVLGITLCFFAIFFGKVLVWIAVGSFLASGRCVHLALKDTGSLGGDP